MFRTLVNKFRSWLFTTLDQWMLTCTECGRKFNEDGPGCATCKKD